MKKYIIGGLLILQSLFSSAKDYPATLFNIRGDGSTLNTRSIQFALDFIEKKGGGTLVFEVGRYLTGSIHLRSSVSIRLQEGAVLVGSLNPFDYDKQPVTAITALVIAYDLHDIAITGKGVIDGQGRELANNVAANYHKGILEDLFRNDRPEVDKRAMIINFRSCRNVLIKGITIRNSASWVETYDQCANLHLDSIYVDSKAYWNNDGIDIVDCDSVAVTNSYIDADDDGVCLKSHDASKFCNHVLIAHNVIRSSANGIKFGTASYGGFRNIQIIDNKVFDTYRSALALEAVDGGFLEDVTVDSLQSFNTGHSIFLRIGERVAGKKGRLERIHIRNVYAEIPAGKPDAGYDYEGPIEDMPRNISPMIIAGLPGAPVSDVTMENITIKYPGGGNELFAKVGLNELDKVPERPAAYPDFSMFRELPAWGLYIRHARQLGFKGLTLICGKKDYRTAIVLDDVHDARFIAPHIEEPVKKEPFYLYRSSDIRTK